MKLRLLGAVGAPVQSLIGRLEVLRPSLLPEIVRIAIKRSPHYW
jgi:hypothetical protein